ncbi:MAG: hypothetical protein JJE46_02435 [Acidimicrobiia bacterium]|nr:hypothetical protein [Acidimicrobiia bacterium]
MRRRTLDLFFVVGGFALAVLLLVLGLVLQSNATFANDYVKEQLSSQRITFTPAANLAPEEKRAGCLVANAGKPLASGPQAECYANEYIALHLTEVNDGKTYSETSGAARAAKTAATAAKEKGAPDAAALDEQAQVLDGKVQTLFRGETLRGLLLTSYGFSEFGRKAGQAALVSFLVAGVLLLASIAGIVHLTRTSKNEVIE